MEWISLLLIALVVFTVFRKVQEAIRAIGDTQRQQQSPQLPRPEPQQLAAEEETASNWAAGWGSWPAETEEEPAWEEIAETAAGVPILVAEPLTEVPAELEADAVTVPVFSLEPLYVDREAEHNRLHGRMEIAAPTPRTRRSAPRLRGRADLRRAVVLAEMLGPPRSLQTQDIPGEPAH